MSELMEVVAILVAAAFLGVVLGFGWNVWKEYKIIRAERVQERARARSYQAAIAANYKCAYCYENVFIGDQHLDLGAVDVWAHWACHARALGINV